MRPLVEATLWRMQWSRFEDFHPFCACRMGEEEAHSDRGVDALSRRSETLTMRKGYARRPATTGKEASPSIPLTLQDGSSNINYCTILRGDPRFSRAKSVHV
jgi:hypothetical protein